MAWRLALALIGGALLALALPACEKNGAAVFTGKARPVVASASEIAVYSGRGAPDEHTIIGVVTTSCATLNGGSGVLAGPCSENAMLELAKERAAEVGGTGIADPICREGVTDKQLERQDGGQVATTIRAQVVCRVTVVRSKDGSVVHAGPIGSTAPTRGTIIDVGGKRVAVTFARAPGAKKMPPRDDETVGVMEEFPSGYQLLGSLKGECLEGCSRSTARRALRRRAAELGAIAIARVRCELSGESWRCQAVAIGDALERRKDVSDAGAPMVADAAPPHVGAQTVAEAGVIEPPPASSH